MTDNAIRAAFAAVTILGDSAVVLPAAAALSLSLWTAGARRSAVAYAGGLAACVGATIFAKVGFMACTLHGAEVHSPSGHASLAVFYYTTLGMIALRLRRPMPGRLLAAGAFALAPLIVASRVAISAHTPLEALIGASVGAGAAFAFSRLRGGDEKFEPRYAAVGLMALAAVALFFRPHATAEGPLEWIAGRLAPMFGCA
jgi:hypothetical protein